MQQNPRRALILCFALALLGTLQGWAQNRVLELDRDDSYVELPAELLKDVKNERRGLDSLGTVRRMGAILRLRSGVEVAGGKPILRHG